MNKETEEKLRQLARDILKEFATAEVDEEWIPKVGDWVVCEKIHSGDAKLGWNGDMSKDVGVPMKVSRVSDFTDAVICGEWFYANEWLRPATPEELAKLEASKTVKFGTRVEFMLNLLVYHGCVACHAPGPDNEYIITFVKSGNVNDWTRIPRKDFKVLDQ